MKTCTKCNITKTQDQFIKRKSSKDGLDSHCVECAKLSAKENREKNRAANKIPLQNKICPSCRISRTALEFGINKSTNDGLRSQCKFCRNAKAKKRYAIDEDFRKKESARFAQMYIENKDTILLRTKNWSYNNPDKKLEQRHRRIARTHGQQEFDLPVNIISYLREKHKVCVYCETDGPLTIEHILPLSRGGQHVLENLALACKTCNYSKNSKTLLEWLNYNKNLLDYGLISDKIILICDNLMKQLSEIIKS